MKQEVHQTKHVLVDGALVDVVMSVGVKGAAVVPGRANRSDQGRLYLILCVQVGESLCQSRWSNCSIVGPDQFSLSLIFALGYFTSGPSGSNTNWIQHRHLNLDFLSIRVSVNNRPHNSKQAFNQTTELIDNETTNPIGSVLFGCTSYGRLVGHQVPLVRTLLGHKHLRHLLQKQRIRQRSIEAQGWRRDLLLPRMEWTLWRSTFLV